MALYHCGLSPKSLYAQSDLEKNINKPKLRDVLQIVPQIVKVIQNKENVRIYHVYVMPKETQ